MAKYAKAQAVERYNQCADSITRASTPQTIFVDLNELPTKPNKGQSSNEKTRLKQKKKIRRKMARVNGCDVLGAIAQSREIM